MIEYSYEALLEQNAKMKKALQEIADGIMPNDELDAILEMSKTDMIRAKGRMYTWCQSRARKALAKDGETR